jgi:hypothetical protein
MTEHRRVGPGKCACGFNAYKVGGFLPDYHQMLMDHFALVRDQRIRNGESR